MEIVPLAIPDVRRIVPRRLGDDRGLFSEVWKASALRDAGIEADFVQDNQSLSRPMGTLRGLHCQVGPNAQGKLVRCLRGAIWDVAVDVRAGSPTYGRWVAETLSGENWAQLWIPPGFLHGFVTLTPDTEVLYKVTAPYDRQAERGVIWNDPTLALPWPLPDGADPVLSGKDGELPGSAAAAGWFP